MELVQNEGMSRMAWGLCLNWTSTQTCAIPRKLFTLKATMAPRASELIIHVCREQLKVSRDMEVYEYVSLDEAPRDFHRHSGWSLNS